MIPAFQITKAKKDMGGKYTVKARNKRGVIENSADLTVHELGNILSNESWI